MGLYAVGQIEMIGPFYAAKLKGAGIRSTRTLLQRARTPKGRKELALATGISEANILKWANIADLMRVRGVAEEYSGLLRAAGVDTVKELKRRNSANLTKRLQRVNADQKLVRLLPSERRVARWIEQAKSLEPMLGY